MPFYKTLGYKIEFFICLTYEVILVATAAVLTKLLAIIKSSTVDFAPAFIMDNANQTLSTATIVS
jgi:hypothetical protein